MVPSHHWLAQRGQSGEARLVRTVAGGAGAVTVAAADFVRSVESDEAG